MTMDDNVRINQYDNLCTSMLLNLNLVELTFLNIYRLFNDGESFVLPHVTQSIGNNMWHCQDANGTTKNARGRGATTLSRSGVVPAARNVR
jgi:hypothetical protein